MRHIILASLGVGVALVGLHLCRTWIMFGTPEKALESMISAGSRREVMRCYSWRTLSTMRRIPGVRDPDCFRFGMIAGRGNIEVVSRGGSGPEAVLGVRTGDGPPYELRFVREGLAWKFDISDKLRVALRAVNGQP